MLLAEPEHTLESTRFRRRMGTGQIAVFTVTFTRFDSFLALGLVLGGLHPYIGELDAV